MAAILSPRMARYTQGSEGSASASSTLFYGFAALIIFGPLAFGAVEDWAILIQQCAAAALLLLWSAQSRGNNLAIRRNELYLPLAVLAATAAAQIIFHASAYPYVSESAALEYIAYYLIFFLANQVLAEGDQLKSFVRILTGFGFALAVLAIVMGFASPGRLYGLRVTSNSTGIYGPYVNHSHYAGLMEMLTPFPLVMTLRRSLPGQHKLLWGVAAFFMAASVFLSGSRGGMLAFGFELVLLLGVFLVRNRSRRAKTAASVTLFFFATVVVWLGSSRLVERLADLSHPEMTGRVRLEIMRDSLHMAAARPVMGWGLGTFAIAYPQFRTFYSNDLVNAAHNDYVQFLAEMGAIGLAAILWFLFAVYRHGIRTIADPESDSAPYIRLAALIGITGIVLHSFTDFNLQTPANIAVFFVLCAIVTNCDPARAFAGTGRRIYVFAFALIMCAYAAFCVRGFVGARWAHSWDEQKLQAASRLTPEDAEPWARLGYLNLFEKHDSALARLDFLKAVARNSYDARSWLELAMACQADGELQQERQALERAIASDPTTPAVLAAAANTYLSGGDEARGLQLLRRLAEHDRESLPGVLELAWRATHDPAAILREIAPRDVDVQIALLNLLTQYDKPRDAAMVWSSISRSQQSYEVRRIFPYVQYLTDHNLGTQAAEAWRRLGSVDKEFLPYERDENLIVNPGFELEMLNAGLDWRYQPVTNVSMSLDAGETHSGRYSLALSFDGEVGEVGIAQLVPVKPNATYTLSGFYRVDRLEGAGGVQWELVDTASGSTLDEGALMNQIGEWQKFEEVVKTGPDTELVRLRLVRVPSHDLLEGKIWIDDIALVQQPGP